jgi:hypothetical protein
VADNRQYVRIGLRGVDYLLSSAAGFVIEKREHLEINSANGVIAAWRADSTGRVPAYSVDADIRPFVRPGWQKAIFLPGAVPAGLVADELQLLAREDVRVEPFRPLGPSATAVGHLFSGAWIRAGRVPILVFEPYALASHLRRLGA